MVERSLSAKIAALEAYRRGLQKGVMKVYRGVDEEVDGLDVVTSQLDGRAQQLLRVALGCAWVNGATTVLRDVIDPTYCLRNPRLRDAIGAGVHYAKLERMRVVNTEG